MRITNVLMITAFLIVGLAVLNYEPTDTRASSDDKEQDLSASLSEAAQKVPKIKLARLKGKKLIVTGEDFDDGAGIFVNGVRQKTKNDLVSPTTGLVAKKAGKKIALDEIIILQIQNSNGQLSEELSFYTGCGSQE